MKQLYTRWGRNLDKEHVLEEYPRPWMVRDSYICLNGIWEYAFTKEYQRPEQYEGEILVPFSPESVLSGVQRQLQPDEYLWYRKMVPVNGEALKKMHLILHFGAVDQSCRIYVNGKEAKAHTGGYLPFEVDVTSYLTNDTEQFELIVAVKDLSDTSYHSRGKQKLKRGGMFYTAQSGIWQTVWMEYVPEQWIRCIETEPDPDQGMVRIRIEAEGDHPVSIRVKEPAVYSVSMGKRTTGNSKEALAEEELCSVHGRTNAYIEISLPVVKLWTCRTPYLYYFTVSMGEDRVESYFALRTFTVEPDKRNCPRICLNHQELFQKGVLDQGYWPDGLYTAPSDEALIFDIEEMKKMGFNMIRKHLKIEPQRWYYHCDRLGMIVWQDMVNGGSAYKHWFVTYAATLISWRNWHLRDVYTRLLSRKEKAGRLEFIHEMKETVEVLKCHPSIAVWVIFNEGWGQFQTEDMTRILRESDATRLIDQASGWFDQKGGDLLSIHNYFFKLKIKTEAKRAAVLSEYGGYSMKIDDHSSCLGQYGYGIYHEQKTLNEAYRKLEQEVQEKIPDGLCASIYTQVSDVEEEVNGIFTYDREVKKINSEII